ncbi:DUF421 domain-containing protein [Alicyclobacillus contaminans]|uniref:DUF421 domain-containing protein n=1 Tax=Alicyclobacillus contaminans TaxID=392016 RepID=UPI0004009C72|nr:DUF421 domain-containing protein [Alicyclobacillus contaminans]GMA51940.1 DUF421 domain-containing protein [Alicyclobacillus contaminans]
MLKIPVWEFCLRILILYIVVAIALRVMGKREIGQLSVFDFVVSIMIAELSTVPMEDTDQPLMQALLSVGALVALQVIVAFLQMKSHRFRHFVDGEPTVLVEHGQIQDKELRRMRYTINDLMMQLREKGIANVADVEFAILETSGKLSVFPKAEHRPVTPTDMNLKVSPESIHMPIIADGVPIQKTLDVLGRDQQWLREELARRGYGQVEDVFFASVDTEGMLFIDPVDAPKDSVTRSEEGTGQRGGQSQRKGDRPHQH